ncbi:hypothetical protein HPB49_009740 [Dermacentor silvarum]|uniref:Uncharacterized protein n=1 Tax=Dermacentor silvarum TaxID=543639 RepID=A0ACB8DNI3_DERSI|nr:hypothetical protein HPB49_009740 [Dermacentor silvarum]
MVHPRAEIGYLHQVPSTLVGNTQTHIPNSTAFVDRVRNIRLSHDDVIVSFDVISLFTSASADFAIAICTEALSIDPSLAHRTPHDPPFLLYVDDCSCILRKDDVNGILQHLNAVEPAIPSSKKQEVPFLDVLLCRSDGSLSFSVYRTMTCTGRYLDFASCIRSSVRGRWYRPSSPVRHAYAPVTKQDNRSYKPYAGNYLQTVILLL